ncbi:hypothetical protein K9B33_21190 [Sphingobium sp. 3R8]|uniref:Uncharacterized protein n=1 Tax=Sphingomonas bisphenolicum TaxID=296544 RepID=A0ABN5WFE7_9SPHN|nr:MULTISPECIES: hypothetical protein [Sphingomonadaceae]MBZ9650052.1 hypothetical protein [Sphingobium sp. 3R8]BBF70989.1 hypothetical protein SBA_ch1_31890 [Sphingomonas bisphenolicum]
MTRKTTRPRQPHRVQPDSHVYLPHSSWTRVERKAAVGGAIAPDDFWARLGL